MTGIVIKYGKVTLEKNNIRYQKFYGRKKILERKCFKKICKRKIPLLI
jgi:hypothetical protein